MVSYTFITERLATGSAIDPEGQSFDANGKPNGPSHDVVTLIGQGFTHIIDMRAEFDDSTLYGIPIVLWLPQQDDGTPRDPKQVLQGIAFALTALSTPKQKVFVHCAGGVNRGPLETYAILRAFGIPQQEAIDRIRTKRPEVGFYNTPQYLASVEQALA